MMNVKIFFLLLLFPFLGFAQKGNFDLKKIQKDLTNRKSEYNYDKLIFKFKGYPKSLDSIEAEYLYYGRNFRKDNISTNSPEFKNLAEAFKSNNFTECIRIGKSLYYKDPTNLDVILILLRAYDNLKDGSNFTHHITQLRLLTGAIKNSGEGNSEKTAYLVNSVGDEYIFLNILNIGQDYSRTSTTAKDGMIDVWEKEGKRVYIKVLYLNLNF